MTTLGTRTATPAVRRWTARAKTLADVDRELTRIWANAAEHADAAELSAGDRADAMGDPHLSGRLDHAGDVRVRTRTSVLTLVVVAPRPETRERALDTINTLAGQHPSRAIILAPEDPDGPPWIDAQIFAQCRLSTKGEGETCSEEILLRAGGELAQHPASCVTPLLIHDLPVVVWWPDDPPIGSRPFRELVETSDRLLVDSGGFRDDGAKRLAALAAMVADAGRAVYDIGWMRLDLWRELLAGLFDHPLLMRELDSIRNVRIDVVRPAGTFRVTKAACFAGWLAAMLDWEVVRPLERRGEEESLVGAFRHGRHEIKLELRPVLGGGKAVRSSGSLVRVELELATRRGHLRAKVTRQADHLLATADWEGAQITRRAGQLEPFGEAPYLAEALHSTRPDVIFERSLARATRLIAG